MAGVSYDPLALPPAAAGFLAERHLASLTTLSADGVPHVTPVGFTYDASTARARVICSAGSVKARNAARGGHAALCQIDGRRWLTLIGNARVVSADPDDVADAEQRYARRYRVPRENPARVVLVIEVQRVLGAASLGAGPAAGS